MTEPKRFPLTLPPSTSAPGAPCLVESAGSIVIVGANGSGKTRLGAWIVLESEHRELTHRVSAQKSLMMPSAIRATSMDLAEWALRSGHETSRSVNSRTSQRWQGNPVTQTLADFEHLMVLLFSEEAEKNAELKRATRASSVRVEPPESKLDIIKRIWEGVLPSRELIIGGGKVETRLRGDPAAVYNGKEMSDGERDVFYLIGQCLATPTNGVIIIDEPELHLHKSIQARLWDKVEAERPDCLFVYLTHDIDFALSRAGATKICLKNYDGKGWDWYLVPKQEGIPEDILLTIVGSRKPVLFVEGTRSSLDYYLFSHLYPEFTVTPCGCCDDVIRATGTFGSLRPLHRLECRGLIDRDHRSDEQVEHLKERNVFAAEVAQVENLYLVEGVIRAVAKELLQDEEKVVSAMKSILFDHFTRERETVISAIVAAEIESTFKTFDAKAQGESGLVTSIQNLFTSINVPSLYQAAEAFVNKIIADVDYTRAIRVFRHKGLVPQMGSVLGQKAGPAFVGYLKKLVATKKGEPVLAAMRAVIPVIPAS